MLTLQFSVLPEYFNCTVKVDAVVPELCFFFLGGGGGGRGGEGEDVGSLG